MSGTPQYIWIDGELRPSSEGVVPFVNAGLHYGYSVFEGIRCYATDRGPAVFRLEEHVDRLLDSALVVGFRDLPYSKGQISRRDPPTDRGQRIFVLLHSAVDLSGRRHEHGGRCRQAAVY